ncbi:probable serine carboxypeptidase CPVL isoform X2 [Phyllostomus hastatus]|uniref:probable serine carboxypeptidase CPVL isoform X2 n=1 Tax=Phyllostomus hastatus TaxID=9423 RepID=UPI001E6844BA|nr:probable serine carboxypeptidase CPVL isoform X2 [Phyllostomus hastatus]
MWKEAVLLALLMLCPSGRGLFYFGSGNTHGSVPCDGGDKGQPLYLTPYIEAGKVVEGRRLSAVPPLQGLDLVSYCGFLTVNKTYNSNLFFWFFPAKMQSSTAPLVVWLQGGPGSSSLFGLFMENGPFAVTKNLTLYLRDFAWTSTLSMLYIDNPVGAGFSFTDDPQGYASNEDDVARDLFSALMQFFQLFPEFQENDFYITGQSYAGKYVPAIAYYIHTLNPTLSLPINLKGIAIGSGFCHPESVLRGYASAMYEMGLLDENQRKYVEEQSQEALEHLKKREWSQALEVLLYNGQLDVLLPASLTERFLMVMNWKGSQEYRRVERKIWKILKSDQEVAGYVRQVGNFHQLIVRGGGHNLPFDQPLRAYDMINRFIYEKGWDPY